MSERSERLGRGKVVVSTWATGRKKRTWRMNRTESQNRNDKGGGPYEKGVHKFSDRRRVTLDLISRWKSPGKESRKGITSWWGR